MPVPKEINVKAIGGEDLGLSQEAFALRFGFESCGGGAHGSRVDASRSRPRACCLMVIDEAPQTVERVLRKVAVA